jgi:hypothetical protein
MRRTGTPDPRRSVMGDKGPGSKSKGKKKKGDKTKTA